MFWFIVRIGEPWAPCALKSSPPFLFSVWAGSIPCQLACSLIFFLTMVSLIMLFCPSGCFTSFKCVSPLGSFEVNFLWYMISIQISGLWSFTQRQCGWNHFPLVWFKSWWKSKCRWVRESFTQKGKGHCTASGIRTRGVFVLLL